jgi:hypothetical protein
VKEAFPPNAPPLRGKEVVMRQVNASLSIWSLYLPEHGTDCMIIKEASNN